MSLETVTLFSGGGLKALGARQAGFNLVGAVEYQEDIASVYRDNLGPCVTVGKVEEVSPVPYVGIDALLASPVCTRASVANANRGESEVDLAAAEGVCHWIRVTRPKCFVMENVTQYREFESYNLIMATLRELGYLYTDDTCNAASWGVPQTRRRMIVRALLGQMPPPLKPTHYNPLVVSEDGGLFAEDTRGMTPWVGWYAAIEDILHTLPESKFADWQLKRLPNELLESTYCDMFNASRMFTTRNVEQPVATITATILRRLCTEPKAFLCGVQGEGGDLYRAGAAPSPTVTTAHDAAKYRAFLVGSDSHEAVGNRKPVTVRQAAEPSIALTNSASKCRAWLEQGRVVRMTPRALARFMSCPDTYRLPESKKLASTVLGNGLPCLLAQRIMEQLKEYIQ